MRPKEWAWVAMLVVAAYVAEAGPSSNMITRLNQQGLNCGITVGVSTNIAQNWYSFTVSIPNDDPRLKRLYRTAFILGTGRSAFPQQLNVPLETKTDGTGKKEIFVGVGKDQLENSFIKFECFWPESEKSSLDVVFLDLKSFVFEEK